MLELGCRPLGRLALRGLLRSKQAFAGLLILAALLLPLGALAQTATTVSITGASPSTFSAAGQTLTFNVELQTGNAEIGSLSFTSGSPTGMSAVNCPNMPAAIQTIKICTFTYTTTSMDVAMGNVFALGRWTATRPGAARRSGTTNGFTVMFAAMQAPTVTSVSPAIGPTSGGTTVVINGTSFTDATAVQFGGTPAAAFTVISDTQISATAPAHVAGTSDVTVSNAVGTSALVAADQFTYVSAPSVTSVSPTGGPASGGTTVVITGTGFAGTTAVTFGATSATGFTVNSNTQITASSPAGTGTVDIRVTTAGGTSSTSAADQFTYIPRPAVTAISPSSGSSIGGTSVTITGTNFAPTTAVTFGATPAIGFTVNSNTQITATAPAGNGTVDVRITSAGGTSATLAADQYTYLTAPVAGAVSVTVAYGSTSNPVTPSLSGGATSSVAIASAATHGTATALGTTMSYTPLPGYSGPDSFTYTATGPGGTSAPATVTVTVSAATLVVTPPSFPNGTVGNAYTQSLATSGGAAPYTYSIAAGSLPAGMSLSASGVLSGTPTAGGTYNFTVRSIDSSTGTGPFVALRAYSLAISAPVILIAPTTLPSAGAGQSYSQSVTASGGTAPYTYAVTSGALPAGLSLSSSGLISGTPTVSGSFLFTVTAVDSSTGTGPYGGSRSYSLSVFAPTITLSPTTLPNATAAVAYTQTLTAAGGTAPYVYSLTAGSLPAGVSLSGGTVSGTPVAVGTFTFTVTATDNLGFSGARSYSLIVNAPSLAMSPASGALPPAVAESAYSQTFAASGGNGPYTYALMGGSLPSGMTLNTGGTLSGTPTVAGTFNFSVVATDSSVGAGAPFSIVQAYSLTIAAPTIDITPTTFADKTVGVAFSDTLSASGGSGPYSFALTSGSLPTGAALTAGGVLSGTPTLAGTYSFSVTATDSFGFTGSRNYSVDVVSPVISLLPAVLSGATVDAPFNEAIAASGGTGPYTYAVSAGALPMGISLSSAGDLSGTPTIAGLYSFSVTATDFYGSTGSRAFTLNVGSGGQAISNFSATPTAPVYSPNGTFAVSATAGASTSPLVFASNSPAICTVSGSTVTMLSAGNCALTADQAADANYTAAPQVALNVTIGAADQTITNFNATPAAPVYSPNGTFAISATAGASTSPLVFASTAPAICTVSGNTVTMLSAGNCALTANQAADANYNAAPQVALNVTIGAADQTITQFSASPSAPVYAPNGTFAVSAVAGASSSPLVFASTAPAVCTVSGNTVTMLSAGNCALTANQAADANYNAAPEVALNVTIGAAGQSITNFNATPTAPIYSPNGTFAVSATAGASTSPLVFASASPAICNVAGNTVTMLSAGNCALTANQAADANYSAAPQVTLNVAIGAAGQSITNFNATPTAPVYSPNGTFALSATAGASTSPLVFASTAPSVCTVSGNTVTMLSAGNCALTVNQAADANYTAAPQVALNVTIGAAGQSITNFTATPTAPVYSPNGTFALAATGGASTSALVFASTTPAICTVAGSTVTMVSAGSCALTANQAADANYTAAPQLALNVVIAAAGPVIGWVQTIQKTQGEASFELPAPSSNSPGAFSYTSSNTGVATLNGRTVTLVGSGTTIITATQAATANYTAGSVALTLVVDSRPDPTKDPSVAAGLQAQLDASLRFASAQQGNVLDRLRQLRNTTGTPSHDGLTLSMSRYGAGALSLPIRLPASAAGVEGKGGQGTWTGGTITYGQRSTIPGRDGYDLRSDGISIGTDHAFGDFVVGGAIGLGWGRTDFNDNHSRQDARQRAFTVYGLWRGDKNWYVESLLGYGELDYDLRRWSAVANATATAKRNGNQQYGSLGVGYTQRNANFDLTGYGRVEGNRTKLDAYREAGLGIYDLAYRAQRIDSSLAALGVEGSFHGKLGERNIRPFWSLEYRSALSGSDAVALNYVVQPSSNDYQLSLRGYADRMWAMGTGFDYDLGRGWNLSFMYRREQANSLHNNTFGLRLVFGGGAPK